MSEPIRESSPMIGPDSLRKINQVNKAFFETHTKRNYGRADVYGSQYSGTVENFGFEMLLESRKLKMQKPSLQGVFAIDNYKYYFDLQYSNMIETYEQQGMLEAVLKKDVFLPNKEYRIRFENCRDVLIPRSESWGSLDKDTPSKVFKDKFIHTTTPPTLIIKDLRSMTYEEITLELNIADDFYPDYYFYNEFATQSHIESYSGGTLLTTPITNDDAGLPFVWICEEIFNSFPPISFVGDVHKLLTIGMDGHGVSHIYPYIYGESSLPSQDAGDWTIVAYSELDGFLPDRPSNYSSGITSLEFVLSNDGAVVHRYPVEFDTDYIKVMMSDKVDWKIARDSVNDPYHAEVNLSDFFTNAEDDTRTVLIEAMDIKFSDDYLFYQYEGLCGGASSGVHVDILSDYTDNAVPKLNGTIHSLGEFDGLPSYFKTMKDRTTHRSHVELYTIRDRINQRTQNPMEKQTAGLIFDSAIPQKELEEAILDQDPAIYYQPDDEDYLYNTNPDKIVSLKNVVSEITFNDVDHFGNVNIAGDGDKPRFIYHGNRLFSLEAIEFDPENEIARVYYVGNDSTSYENNSSAEAKRPARTLARICDIPTSYEQLIHQDNTFATYLFDSKYVRMECGMSLDDLQVLMNERGLKLVMTPYQNNQYADQWIYPDEASLPDKPTLVDSGYYVTVNVNNPDIPITSANFERSNGGLDYQVGDTFYVLVGGKAYDGVVTEVSFTGYVDAYTIDIPDDAKVSVYNLEGVDTLLKTCTVNSESGHDFQLKLSINSPYINAHTPTPNTEFPPENLIALAFDTYGNIFLYGLKSDWTWEKVCQVSGVEAFDNIYDDSITREYRSFNNAFFANLSEVSSFANETIYTQPMDYIDEQMIVNFAVGIAGDTPSADLSENIVGYNNENTYYRLICTDNADGGHFNLKTYQLKGYDNYEAMLPRFNHNNTLDVYKPCSRLLISNAESLNKCQPTLFTYAPSHNKRMDGYRMLTDKVFVNSSHVMTYRDYGSDIVDPSGYLTDNVYYYPEYEHTQSYKDYENTLREMQRSELIDFIRDNFGSGADPFAVEEGDFRYSYEQLIRYVMDRYPLGGFEVKDDLKPHNYAGDLVIDPQTNLPLGTPPTGAFVPLTAEVIETKVTTDGTKLESELVNIFIIDDTSFQGFTSDFRVHDENGVDITSSSVIIWRGNKYIFRSDTWTQLSKRIVEGYLNPSDLMFYYDSAYSQMITPDPDLTYQDITSGQYYKWNGSSYVLIII